ncbi:beta strand repeat-containing protein [Rudanella lutea]|uniref:beta strand repeat-containing protein n=1 Tax=Rudanella lutea TaxID=451374 RepID=UPI0003A3185C|nr:T9SS type A sorting domain-containing protein [Rudanella lutea]
MTLLNANFEGSNRPAYTGTGSIILNSQTYAGVSLNLYFLTSASVWVLEFDGQAYLSNTSTGSLPPTTGWLAETSGVVGPCTGNTPLAVQLPATLATVTTTAPSDIRPNRATLGGNVTNDGGGAISERGVVYITGTSTPTISNTKIMSGTGTGAFSVTATGLNPNTLYSVRAYAINSAGPSYGTSLTFTTSAAPTPLTVSIIQTTNVSCAGGANGSLSASASGGVGSYTYNWTPGNPAGDGTATITGLAAGSYTITVTDNQGTSATAVGTVTQPNPIFIGNSQTNVSCNGNTNGSISVSPTGGSGGFTYRWSNSATTSSINNLAAGVYSVTVTDANSCTATRSFTITQPPALVTSSSSQINVSCNGGSTGSASVAVSGGTPGYTYSWAPSGGTAATANGLSAGIYTVTITDANACTTTRSFTITQPPALAVSSSQTNVSCNGGNNGTASVSVSGGAPGYTYSWAPSGGTAATANGLSAGTYIVTITDANGCVATQAFTITQPAPLVASTIQNNVICNGATNGSATVTPSGGVGGYTYSWAPSGGTAATATGLAAGSYTVTITDANGCIITRSFTITQPPALVISNSSQTNVSCNGGNTGAASVAVSGGVGGYTYLWTPSGAITPSATGLTAGIYTVLITDANGCTITRSFTITQPPALAVATSQTNVSCNGGNNGAASVSVSGGAPGYTYSWAPSGGTAATASNLTAGTYTVTITDANACTTTRSFTITQQAAITITPSQTNVTCNGLANGAAAVSVSGSSGPYTYSWAPSGGNAATATGLAAGSYTVTITDANGCVATQPFTITQPPSLVLGGNQTNVSCNGAANGSATVSPTGGAGGFTYRWSNSATTGSINNLAAGVYSVTVTDANLCTATRSFTITQPSVLVTTSSQTDVSCNGGTNGSATVTPSGGVGGYTYSWAPSGGTAATATGLAAGNYTVTITDANGCTTTRNFTITQPPVLAATMSQTNVSTFAATDGRASVSVSGGAGNSYTYDWTPGNPTGDGTNTISGLAAGLYSVLITDPNGCTISQSVNITQPGQLTTPAPVVLTPANGSLINTATPTITGTSAPNSTITVFVDGSSVGTTTANGAGNWTLTLSNALAQGSHTVRARAQLVNQIQSPDSNTNTFTVDSNGPGVTLNTTATNPTQVSPIPVTIAFTESVTGLTLAEISVSNGTASNLTGSGSSYNVNIIPAGTGLVTVSVAAGVAQDNAGNQNLASNGISIQYNTPNSAPTVANAIPPQSATVGQAFTFTIPANTFTDIETPNSLTLSVAGLPPNLTFSGNTISGLVSSSGTSNVTVTATDPGGLSVNTTFIITTASQPFGGTVVSYNCQTGAIVLGSVGSTGGVIEYFAIGVTGWTTNPNQIIEAGLRADPKPITIQVRQNGVEGLPFIFNFGQFCGNNTPPLLVNAVPPQSATVGVPYTLNLGNVFTDAQTPGQITLSGSGVPAGLNLIGTFITGTPSASGVSTITLTATDPGGLSSSTSFVLTVSPVGSQTGTPPPTGGLLSATVVSYNCSTGAIVFGSTGGNGSAVEYLSIGITGWTINTNHVIEAGLRADPKPITVQIRQNGVLGQAFVFDFGAFCAGAPQPPVSTTSCGSPTATLGSTLQVTGVTEVNCQTGSFRILTSGGNGSPISYANLVGLSNADPNNCLRVLDNPDLIRAVNNPASDIGPLNLRVTQNGVTSNTFSFNFKQFCTGTARIARAEDTPLEVTVLGNPTTAEWVTVRIAGAGSEAIALEVADTRGHLVSQQQAVASQGEATTRVRVGASAGMYVLRVSTPTRTQTVKIVRQ